MYSSRSHERIYGTPLPSAAILFLYMIFGSALSARGQVGATPLNQILAQGQGAGNNYYLIASTPPDNDSDGDHMHLVMTFNCNAYSNCNSTLDATFGNRGGFIGTYSARGASPTGLDVHLVAYRQPDNSTNIYIYLGNYFVSATYSVLENAGDTIYTNPTANAATPTGILVFDSSSTQYPPSFYSNFAGQLSSAGIVFPDSSVQTTAYVPGAITNANGVITIQNPAGTAGIQIATNSQAVGGLFGEGGNLILQADSVSDTAFTGGTIFLGGTHRGDTLRSQTYLYGESAIGGNTPTGILIDGQDRGSGIQNNVGIGLPSGGIPAAKLDVQGSINVSGSVTIGSGGSLHFPDGSQLSSASGLVASGISASNGNTTVSGDLHVTGNTNPNLGTQGGYFGWNALTGGTGETDFINQQGGGAGGFACFNAPPSGTPTTLLMFLNGTNGNLGIGTASPAQKLEVVGNMKLTGTGSSIIFSDNSEQATAWNGILQGGDYAESVDVTGNRAEYEPGDVLVVDPSREGRFAKSSGAYSTAVMGIYSTRPGLVGRRQKSDRTHMAEEVPMAMIGVVPTKVTNEGGPIKPGDLLVTSSNPGYAMKGTDHSQMMGAIIGKALGHLDAGTGLIEVAVSLQ